MDNLRQDLRHSVRSLLRALPAVLILSHELWQSAFGGQPMVGQLIEVNGLAPRGNWHHAAWH